MTLFLGSYLNSRNIANSGLWKTLSFHSIILETITKDNETKSVMKYESNMFAKKLKACNINSERGHWVTFRKISQKLLTNPLDSTNTKY